MQSRVLAGRPAGGRYSSRERDADTLTLADGIRCAEDAERFLTRNHWTDPSQLRDTLAHRLSARFAAIGPGIDDIDRVEAYRDVHADVLGYTPEQGKVVRAAISELRASGHAQEAEATEALLAVLHKNLGGDPVARRPVPVPQPRADDRAARFIEDHGGVREVGDLSQGEIPDVVRSGADLFFRVQPGVEPNEPTLMRVQTDRELGDDGMREIRNLLAYRYVSTVAAGYGDAAFGLPRFDSPTSFVVEVEPDVRWNSVGRMLGDLDGLVRDGSPIRSSDRAGAGTRGTRLIEGLGTNAPGVHIYFNDIAGLGSAV